MMHLELSGYENMKYLNKCLNLNNLNKNEKLNKYEIFDLVVLMKAWSGCG